MGKIGVIGTGAIGSRLCGLLTRAGREVLAYDINPAAFSEAVRRGASAATSAPEVAAVCETVILCLTDERSVEQVVGEITPALPVGALIIDTTSSHPGVSQRLAAALEPRGVTFVDAPVSRGVPAAENGTLSIMVGGSPEAVERARPILRIFGPDIYHAGPVGTGHAVKALNMLLLGVSMAATAEVMAVAQKSGVDPHRLIEVLDASSGRSYATSFHYKKWILPRTYASNFTVGLMAKDVRLGVEMARECGLPALVAGRLQDLYLAALRSLAPDDDNTRIVPFVEGLAGIRAAVTCQGGSEGNII